MWRKAWRPASGIDDSGELVPYRAALSGWFGCLAFVLFWLWQSGLPAAAIPLFTGMVVIYYIMITRVVTAGGIPTSRPPIVAPYVVISGMGASVLGTRGLVSLGFAMGWQAEMRLFPMIPCANALKLAEIVPGPKGRLFWGMLIALLCSLGAGTWLLLTLGYEHGGINMVGPLLSNGNNWHFLNPQLNDPPEANLRGWLFTGIGAAVEGFLMWARHRWYWWPLHPLGFPIAVGFITSHIWFSALLAWTLKAGILKYGGIRLFSGMRPFFLGPHPRGGDERGVLAVRRRPHRGDGQPHHRHVRAASPNRLNAMPAADRAMAKEGTGGGPGGLPGRARPVAATRQEGRCRSGRGIPGSKQGCRKAPAPGGRQVTR